MSIEALSWGINQDTDTPTSKLVLLVLCNYANMDNKCFPSEKHLSKLCGVSERSIRRCIKQLKEKNLIQVRLRNFNSNETSDAPTSFQGADIHSEQIFSQGVFDTPTTVGGDDSRPEQMFTQGRSDTTTTFEEDESHSK